MVKIHTRDCLSALLVVWRGLLMISKDGWMGYGTFSQPHRHFSHGRGATLILQPSFAQTRCLFPVFISRIGTAHAPFSTPFINKTPELMKHSVIYYLVFVLTIGLDGSQLVQKLDEYHSSL